MKLLLKFIVCFVVLSSTIFSAEAPRLVLYFDINKTLIASDKAANRTINDVLNELLAEKYTSNWDGNEKEIISFDAYAKKVTSSKDEKKAIVQSFISYLEKKQHALLPEVLRDYEIALNSLNQSQGMVFPSFYFLLNYLDEEKIPYSIILRSFGEEVLEVKEEIEAVHPLTFEIVGKFKNDTLTFEDGKIIEGANAIYQYLKHLKHAAIQDDWCYWNAQGQASTHGKPFIVNFEDTEILPIFFDDNIRLNSSYKNIIAPIDAQTGDALPIKTLIEFKHVVRVDTLEAILNKDYYINLVKEALDAIR